MKRREYFLYEKTLRLYSTFSTVTSHLSQRSTILEIIPWTQNAYTLLHQPRHRDASSSLRSDLNTNSAPLWPGISKMMLCWHRGDVTVPKCWIKSFFCVQKVFLSLHNVTNLAILIQNILNCVLKINEAFTGLERHGGKWKMTFSFWGGVFF